MMEGDSDMLSSIIIAFVQAMIRCPAVQKKAQQDIDSVGERMPGRTIRSSRK